MKKNCLVLLGLILQIALMSQSPNTFSYQAVLRNSDGAVKANETVSVQIEILHGSINGTSAYLEIHNTTTSALGLIILEIGSGATSDDISTIDWSNGPYFLNVTVNGTNLGATQLLSVPYALHSKSAETITGEIEFNETDPTFTAWDKSTGISITESQVSDLQSYLATEVDPQFAAWDKATGIVITESQISDLQTYLTAETDPTFTAWDKSTGISISESQISDLQTYLSTEIDPTFTAWDKATGIVITESQISDLQTYLTSETDPAFTNWDKSTDIIISESQISDLKAYLTAEVDPQFASWDKATGIVITESQISDLQTYLTSETDPVYASSQAVNITMTDITNLSNLSGTNGGDQDINGIAENTLAIQDTAAQIRSAIPNIPINVSSFANDAGYITHFSDSIVLKAPNSTFYKLTVQNDGSLTTDSIGTAIVTDIDDNTYETVTIGNQIWMVENLKVTHYPDGSAIPLVTDNTEWGNLGNNNTDDAYCYYNNNSSSEYGGLYTYAAAINACPAGWHLPSDAEWSELENYLADNGYNYDGTIGGGRAKIAKAMATSSGWDPSSNTGDVGNTDYPEKRNASEFSCLPGGVRHSMSSLFSLAGRGGYWWSSTDYGGVDAYNRSTDSNFEFMYRYNTSKSTGHSIRCVRD